MHMCACTQAHTQAHSHTQAHTGNCMCVRTCIQQTLHSYTQTHTQGLWYILIFFLTFIYFDYGFPSYLEVILFIFIFVIISKTTDGSGRTSFPSPMLEGDPYFLLPQRNNANEKSLQMLEHFIGWGLLLNKEHRHS